jgi:hypothetical protein
MSCPARDRQIARALKMRPFDASTLAADEAPLYEEARALELLAAAELGRWKSGLAFDAALTISQTLLTLVVTRPEQQRDARALKFHHILACVDETDVAKAFRDKRGDETTAAERRVAFCAAFDALRAHTSEVYVQ